MKLNYSLKRLTTIKIGGPARYFNIVKSESDLIKSIKWAENNSIRWLVIGEGSNLVPSDGGFDGLIIKNQIKDIKINGNRVIVGSGHSLLSFINKINRFGLSGLEKMAGIPGTVGGAVYGSAGAYGQEIKDNIVRVRIFDGSKLFSITKEKCKFGYRHSIFKINKKWIITSVEFRLKRSKSKELLKVSKDIIKERNKKYPKDLQCPGSFFKNIIIEKIRPILLRNKFLLKIPREKMNHGKVTAGYLLECVGAKSMKSGKIKVAEYHGNLVYNSGNGRSADVTKLAKILKNRVYKKFGIMLEEEIQYI